MKTDPAQLSVRLSHLVPSRRNPRKVKPGPEAQARLVALIRSQGLLQSLVVRPVDAKKFEVIAGEERLKALKVVHKGKGDPLIPCVLRDVDDAQAEALALAENVGRTAMHPIDEADAFAKLAASDGKDAQAIAAEFGVTEHYVRQRMKLAALAEPIKAAHRAGAIDTAIAEAFSAVPEDRQLEVWQELKGQPRHAEQVRNVIANAWIDAQHALFDLASLPEAAVSRDLFGDRVLIERQAFFAAQAAAMQQEHQALSEAGWKEVVIASREDVQDRLYAMDTPPREYDPATSRKLDKVAKHRAKLEAAAQALPEDDQAKLHRLEERFETLDAEVDEIVAQAPAHYSEETKSLATVFLVLDPDGRVHREYRLPRPWRQPGVAGDGADAGTVEHEPLAPPTSADVSDKQRAVTFTHQALAVREALLGNAPARTRLLAMILHEKIRSEALAIRHDANGTTLCASSEGFVSPAFARLQEKRATLDPFVAAHFVDETDGYAQLTALSAAQLEALVDLLVVEHLTAHMLRPTPLVQRLAAELKVNVRDHWRPDAAWLAGFQKIQLAHLVTELKGAIHAPSPDKKKSDLVAELAKLFADAAEGKLEDKALAATVNAWLPANLRPDKEDEPREGPRAGKRK